MRRRSVVALTLSIFTLALGCNPRAGLIALDTDPQGATVYMNDVRLGETPVRFEFNMERPSTLRILKEGYHPRTETLSVVWVKSEYRQGHYVKGDFLISGEMQRGFEVRTSRDLIRVDGTAPPVAALRPDRVTSGLASPSNHEWKCHDKAAQVPRVVTGDQWTMRDDKGLETTQRIVGTENGLTTMRWPSGDLAFYDEALVLRKVVKKNGETVSRAGAGTYVTIGQKTLDFPLEVGKKWDYSFMAMPASGTGNMTSHLNRFEVVSCHEVVVPAGKYDAFKIRVDQSAPGSHGGTYYLWWAPEARNYVKRQYVYSDWWRSGGHRDFELVKAERP